MANFGINKEGVAALRQLEKDLKSINTEIETSGKTLKAAVSGIGEGPGDVPVRAHERSGIPAVQDDEGDGHHVRP